jgi:hypothetical protein
MWWLFLSASSPFSRSKRHRKIRNLHRLDLQNKTKRNSSTVPSHPLLRPLARWSSGEARPRLHLPLVLRPPPSTSSVAASSSSAFPPQRCLVRPYARAREALAPPWDWLPALLRCSCSSISTTTPPYHVVLLPLHPMQILTFFCLLV